MPPTELVDALDSGHFGLHWMQVSPWVASPFMITYTQLSSQISRQPSTVDLPLAVAKQVNLMRFAQSRAPHGAPVQGLVACL